MNLVPLRPHPITIIIRATHGSTQTLRVQGRRQRTERPAQGIPFLPPRQGDRCQPGVFTPRGQLQGDTWPFPLGDRADIVRVECWIGK